MWRYVQVGIARERMSVQYDQDGGKWHGPMNEMTLDERDIRSNVHETDFGSGDGSEMGSGE